MGQCPQGCPAACLAHCLFFRTRLVITMQKRGKTSDHHRTRSFPCGHLVEGDRGVQLTNENITTSHHILFCNHLEKQGADPIFLKWVPWNTSLVKNSMKRVPWPRDLGKLADCPSEAQTTGLHKVLGKSIERILVSLVSPRALF